AVNPGCFSTRRQPLCQGLARAHQDSSWVTSTRFAVGTPVTSKSHTLHAPNNQPAVARCKRRRSPHTGRPGGTPMNEQDRTEVDRRGLLAAGAAAVGGLALVDAVSGAADAPGKQVEDRGAGLKITRLRAMTAGPKAYVKIETNHKITG